MAALAAACVLGAPAGARAYEDQITLGLGIGYANFVARSQPANGAVFDAVTSVGLSPVWTLRARLAYGLHPAQPPLHVGIAGLELLYLIDVVEVVPYFGIGVDGFGHARSGAVDVDAASHAVVGADYLLSRDMAIGLELRPYVLWTALDRDPAYLVAVATVTWLLPR